MPKPNRDKEQRTAPRVAPIPIELVAPVAANEATDSVSVLVFEIGGHLFAIGVDHTEGVVECPATSPLPSPPEGIVGVASVRGRMTLVLDLSLDDKHLAAKRRLILLKGEAQLGLLADRVDDVLTLEQRQLKQTSASGKPGPRAPGESWPSAHSFKHGGRRVPIIDAEGIAPM